mmetsp:Transcript_3716/g.9012  ORF Transcript_3716/g.9012 Transcript_3716/m.9012 type:complete len:330 (+) Transcript_3716:1455-2444(+)
MFGPEVELGSFAPPPLSTDAPTASFSTADGTPISTSATSPSAPLFLVPTTAWRVAASVCTGGTSCSRRPGRKRSVAMNGAEKMFRFPSPRCSKASMKFAVESVVLLVRATAVLEPEVFVLFDCVLVPQPLAAALANVARFGTAATTSASLFTALTAATSFFATFFLPRGFGRGCAAVCLCKSCETVGSTFRPTLSVEPTVSLLECGLSRLRFSDFSLRWPGAEEACGGAAISGAGAAVVTVEVPRGAAGPSHCEFDGRGGASFSAAARLGTSPPTSSGEGIEAANSATRMGEGVAAGGGVAVDAFASAASLDIFADNALPDDALSPPAL